MSRGWLVSPAFDLALMVGPALASVALALVLPTAPLPLLGYVAFVLCIDVAHVYASLYRTYLDREELARHPLRYGGLPLAVWAGCTALYGASATGFWTVLAYLAVFHFVRQQVGVAALYRVAEGLPTRDPAARVERAALYAVTGFPVLWWHAHLPRTFDWFLPGDFLVGLPVWTLWPAGLATAGVLLAHTFLRVRSRQPAPGRDLWLFTTAAAWFSGIVLTDGDLAFTATNVVLHGVPYLALVGLVAHRSWVRTGRGPAFPAWFTPRGALLFFAPLLALAIAEEGLWDGLVWHDAPALFGDWPERPGWTRWVVPLLSVPQVTHYLLDGWIWRMGTANPGLRELLIRR